MTNTLEHDARNRIRALDLTSFIVEAPAGAGKTELLTQRYLRLLQTANAPEEIIAITFTNKAAAEMRLRILDSLIQAAHGILPEKPHKQITHRLSIDALRQAHTKNWQLIENPSRLRIFTIDSLCAYLARQMPIMSRFGTQPKVNDDANTLYAEAAEQTIALLEDATYGATVKTALRYVENNIDQLKKLLILMLKKRDQWLHHAQQSIDISAMQAALKHMVQQEMQVALNVLPFALQQQLMPVARFAASHLPCDHCIGLLVDWDTPLLAKSEAIAQWRAVIDLILTDKDEPRKEGGINIKLGFPATDEARAHKASLIHIIETISDFSALQRIRYLPNLNQDVEQWHMISALSQLLKLATGQLWLTFQAAGEVDFTEIASRATQALSASDTPTDLALRLDYQIKHLLVDEFQDTSPSQIELLKQLTAGWQADDHHTLFLVGDPMQSIYRFRKANVGLFIDAAQHGIGSIKLEKLQLYRNNRSCPSVIGWINQNFATIFPKLDDMDKGAIRYRPFIATKEDEPQSGIEIHPIISLADENQDVAQQREATQVIEIVQEARKINPNQKIAILVRSKKHLSNLVSQLRRNHSDITFQAVEIEALKNRQVVQDLLSLTHALHHRADRVHWLAILRAPWCGLNLNDLHTLAGDDHNSTIWTLMQDDNRLARMSADGQSRLHHIRTILNEAFLTQGRINISRWVRGIWLMLAGANCLWEQTDIIDVQAFFTCIDRLDRSNAFSLERMEIEITKLFATPDVEGQHLQMMTIHKSKGLEFDTVILPGLGTKSGGSYDNKPLVLWEEVIINDARQLIAAPFIPKGLRSKEKVSTYDYLTTLESERDTHEAARVLYVAATRAKRKLHLVGIAHLNNEDKLKPLANTYLNMLWNAVEPTFESFHLSQQCANSHISHISDRTKSIKQFTPSLVRLKRLSIPDILQENHHLSHTRGLNTSLPISTLIDNHQSIEVDIGILTHKYLDIIAKQGLQHWPLARISTLSIPIKYWLQQQGHALSLIEDVAEYVQTLLRTVLESFDGQWVLQHRAEAESEYAISIFLDDETKNYVIDRTFIEDGIRWIIDYKSINIGQNSDENMLLSIVQQYKAQLQGYATLFQHENLPIKCAVLLLSIGKLIEI